MKKENSRCANTQEEVHKIKNIPEFISGSSTQVVTQAKQQAWKMPK